MKRILVFIIIVTVILLLSGCAKKIPDTPQTELPTSAIITNESAPSIEMSTPTESETVPVPVRELKPAIFPKPSGEVIPSGTISVEAFLRKVNIALADAGWDELLPENAGIDSNMDEEPYPDFYFVYFNFGGYEIDFVANRDTDDLISIFISILSEDEYDVHETEYYFKLFLILLEPNAYDQILDELDTQQISHGEDWYAMRQSALLNIAPNI